MCFRANIYQYSKKCQTFANKTGSKFCQKGVKSLPLPYIPPVVTTHRTKHAQRNTQRSSTRTPPCMLDVGSVRWMSEGGVEARGRATEQEQKMEGTGPYVPLGQISLYNGCKLARKLSTSDMHGSPSPCLTTFHEVHGSSSS